VLDLWQYVSKAPFTPSATAAFAAAFSTAAAIPTASAVSTAAAFAEPRPASAAAPVPACGAGDPLFHRQQLHL